MLFMQAIPHTQSMTMLCFYSHNIMPSTACNYNYYEVPQIEIVRSSAGVEMCLYNIYLLEASAV